MTLSAFSPFWGYLYIDTLADEVINFFAAECILGDMVEEDSTGIVYTERDDFVIDDNFINIFAA